MSGPARKTVMLQHGRVALALHELRLVEGGWPLLMLHGLGEQSPDGLQLDVAGWNGSVYALDFTGHGASTVPAGGGYTSEVLMADVDAALEHLGACTVLGRGLGGYIALLIAGARPTLVRGAIIDDGLGLFGGAAGPGSSHLDLPNRLTGSATTPDPYALLELSADVRPGDYAVTFALAAANASQCSVAIAVTSRLRPAWLQAILEQVGVEAMEVTDALAVFSGTAW